MVGAEPYVIEYNCRMGDPETEVVIPRIESDLLAHIDACFNGNLADQKVKIKPKSATTVMMVSGGYPEAYEKGKEITIPANLPPSLIFQAGTKVVDGKLLTNGGRVIAITSFADNFKEAVANSMSIADQIQFDKKNFRRDIGFDL